MYKKECKMSFLSYISLFFGGGGLSFLAMDFFAAALASFILMSILEIYLTVVEKGD